MKNYKYVIIFLFGVIFISIVAVCSVYPFIGLADGFSRWRMAIDLIENGKIDYNTVLSPILALVAIPIYGLTNSFALFTFIQAFCFYCAIGVLYFVMLQRKTLTLGTLVIPVWFILSFATILIPTFLVFPLLLTDSAFCFVSIVIIIATFLIISNSTFAVQKNSFKVLIFILFSFNIVFLIALRINAITVGALLIVFFFFSKCTKKHWMILLTFVLIFFGANFSRFFVVQTFHAETLGMMWELTSIAKNTESEKLISEMDEFGDTSLAIECYNDRYCNGLFWDNKPPFPVWSIAERGNANRIRKLYINTFLDNPKYFITNKLIFMSNVLGINKPLIDAARGIHYVDDITKSFGAMDTTMNKKIRDIFISFTNYFKILTRRPYILFVLNILILSAQVLIFKKPHLEKILILLSAMAYYGAFLINSQAHEFRYFAPAFFILFILLISMMIEMSEQVIPGQRHGGINKEIRRSSPNGKGLKLGSKRS